MFISGLAVILIIWLEAQVVFDLPLETSLARVVVIGFELKSL
jgi:hypothetical protein